MGFYVHGVDPATPSRFTSSSHIPNRARVVTGAMPDCPLSDDSDNVSVTNSEVESAMNHRRRRATMRDPNFTEEAFNAFSSADAYIRAAWDGLNRATEQHLKDVQVSLLSPNMITICQ